VDFDVIGIFHSAEIGSVKTYDPNDTADCYSKSKQNSNKYQKATNTACYASKVDEKAEVVHSTVSLFLRL
jgi:hypothetical protein